MKPKAGSLKRLIFYKLWDRMTKKKEKDIN